MHDVFTFSFPWEYFDMKYIKLITLISPRGIHNAMGEHDADKRDLSKWDCPELNISLDKRCIYVNTGHCWKHFRRQVCVYRSYGTYAYVRVWVFVLVRPPAWERYTKTTRTLSLASYILYGVKLQSNTHPNETTDTETNRIKRTEAKSYFENCVASLLGGKKELVLIEMPAHHLPDLKGKRKGANWQDFYGKAAQPCVQTFVSMDTSWKGGKREREKKKKKTQYTV